MNKIRGLKTRKTLLTNYQALIGVSNIVDKIIIATLIALVLLFAVWTRDGIGTGGKTLAIVFCITLGLLFLNRRGYPREAGLSLFLVLILAFTYLAIHEDGIYNVPFIYFPILLISAGIIFGRPMIPLFTAIIIGITIILFTLDRMGVIVPFGGVVEWKPDFFAIVLIILIATSAILQLVMGTIETNLEQMVRSEQLIKKTYELTLEGWAKALEVSGRETPGHSKRIVIMVKEFSDSLRLPEKVKEEIVTGALVHDIGKMGIPDSILLKPGKLSDEEFEVSKQHVSLAQKIFEDVPYIQAAIDILSCHHEQWDGQGYPNRLEGKKIPYSARIFTIVDNWDSLTNRQVYREAWPEEETCDYLREQAGKKFDREIVEAFLNFISKKRGGKTMDKPRMLKPFTLNYYDRVINLPKIISIILTVMLGTGILISIALVVTKSPSKASPAVIALVIFSAIFYVANKMGYHKLVAMGTFLITSAVMTYNSVYDNGIYDVALIAFPVVIVLASLLLGYRFVWPIILVVLIMLAGIYQLSLSGFTTPYHGLVTTQTQDFWTVVTAMVVTGILVYIIMSIIERNVNQILSSEQQLQRAYESTLRGWARALELRDQETEGHSQRVTHMTLKLAKKMGIPEGELKFIRWGSLLHDIGKMAIPDTILLKKENLNEDELEIVRRHPEIAKQLLQEIPYLERAIVIPYYHHERWDGSGFPNGLKGKEIPLPARIFAVVDVWDALISERSYKEAWPIAKAKEYLSEQSGKLFDPVIVEAFLEFINTTPPKTS